jgi:hypothetical protein
LMYFVPECTTTSAPSFKGFWRKSMSPNLIWIEIVWPRSRAPSKSLTLDLIETLNFSRNACYQQNASCRKTKGVKFYKNSNYGNFVLYIVSTNSYQGATDLARKGPTFP